MGCDRTTPRAPPLRAGIAGATCGPAGSVLLRPSRMHPRRAGATSRPPHTDAAPGWLAPAAGTGLASAASAQCLSTPHSSTRPPPPWPPPRKCSAPHAAGMLQPSPALPAPLGKPPPASWRAAAHLPWWVSRMTLRRKTGERSRPSDATSSTPAGGDRAGWRGWVAGLGGGAGLGASLAQQTKRIRAQPWAATTQGQSTLAPFLTLHARMQQGGAAFGGGTTRGASRPHALRIQRSAAQP